MPRPVALFDAEPLYDTLQQGQLVLTPNQRLASRLRNAYVLAAARRNMPVVPTPRVFSLSAWIDRQGQSLLAQGWSPALARRVLTPHQERHLWEQIVADTDIGQALLRPAATARHAMNAYQLLVEWQLSPQGDAVRAQLLATEDSATWLQWAEHFDALCQRRGLISTVRLPELLLDARAAGVLPAEPQIALVGFLDLSPLHRRLLDAFGPQLDATPQRQPGRVRRVQCDTAQQEIQAAAMWAKQVLRQDSAATVAIVVPDLNRQRAYVERAVMEIFEPGYHWIGAAQTTPDDTLPPGERRALPFNLSAGYPLLDAPIVRAALQILSLPQPELELALVEALCQSPFSVMVDGDSDRVARLLTRCRRQRTESVNSARLRNWAQQIGTAPNTGEEGDWAFAAALQQSATLARRFGASGRQRPEAWLAFFQQQLELMGWPGQRPLDTIEFQQFGQWQEALRQFAVLDCVDEPPALSLPEALTRLRGILSSTVFQPQTADSALQVLGTLEAVGLQFSHIWLTGMSSRDWPPAPAPNPLLPPALQKRAGMPHSGAAREYQYAKTISNQFIRSAPEVVISAPATVDDSPVTVSRLFDPAPQVALASVLGRELAHLLPVREIRRRYFDSRRIETVAVATAPPVDQTRPVRGGAALFTDQSACPFRAFARHRLQLQPLDQPESGLSASERGSVLHRALELLWTHLQTQGALVQQDQASLQAHCQQAAEYALNQLLARTDKPLGPRFRQLETRRLQQLLLAWLAVEQQRAPFSVVATEQRGTYTYGALELDIRLDRVDRLEDGGHLVIDYKTGASSVADWWGPRPEQPQLPLYATLMDAADSGGEALPVSGIAYARLAVTGCEWKGAAAADCPDSALAWNSQLQSDSGEISWEQQKLAWRRVLAALADDFIAGRAAVDPKHHPRRSPKTCQYCHLQSVCRIGHQELEQ